MKKIISSLNIMKTGPVLALMLLMFLITINVKSQERNISFVFSENFKGGTTMFGNTLMNRVNPDLSPDLVAMNGNSVDGYSLYDNGDFGNANMQYVDIDGNTGEGAGTRNSSSADLILPAGTNTIKLARLYWGGRAYTAQFDMTQPANQTIKIRKGTSGAYQEFAAAQFNRLVTNPGLSNEFSQYQAYIDITELVKLQGAGTYTVGNGAFSTGTSDNYGNYGGWSIVIVYENPASDYNSVRVYDGFKQVYAGNTAISSTVIVTGLNLPATPIVSTDARLGIVAWDGDARFAGESLRINNILYSDAVNPIDNPWNGTITNNGIHVTSKNPNYTDQMALDIDQTDVGIGYGILPNAKSVTLELGTTQDQFFCGIITFVAKMKAPPVLKLIKTVTDASNSGTAEAGEVLTYKLTGTNISLSNVNSIVLTDSIPATMTYVPNTLKVISSPGITAGIYTDAAGDDIAEFASNTVTFRLGTGATSATGGTLAAGESFDVEFKVTVNLVAGIVPPIINVARLTGKTDGLVDYVEDATATISPISFGNLPVTLTSFTANLQANNQVKVAWSTSQEINSRRFDIERSTDAVNFRTISTKAAAGNSSTTISYTINDDITGVTTPILYYRLKQVDFDGKTHLSKVASVKLKKAISDFTVSPNPFRNNVNINIEWDKNETTVVKVFNVAGSEVVVKNVQMIKGYNYIAIDELSKLQPGNYMIQFTTATGKLIKQVVKQN